MLVKLWPDTCEHTFSSTSYSAHNKDSTGYYLVCNKCNEKVYCDTLSYGAGYSADDCTIGYPTRIYCKTHGIIVASGTDAPDYSSHDFQLITPASDATASEHGNTAKYKCSRCSTTSGGQTTHYWQLTERNAPTCDTDGYEEYTCTIYGCEATNMVNIGKLGHTPGAEATCTTAQICTVCGETLVEALGHSYVGSTCTRCGTAKPGGGSSGGEVDLM